MAVNAELRYILKSPFGVEKEDRMFVPISFAHNRLRKLASERHSNDLSAQDRAIARYSPMTEWLARPKTVKQFNVLKSELFSLVSAQTVDDMMRETAEYSIIPGEFIPGPIDISGWRKNQVNWLESIDWLINLSAELRIMPREHIEYIQERRKQRGEKNWKDLEGYHPENSGYVQVHNSLKNVVNNLSLLRYTGLSARRVGLVIGDFRVGTHKAHREFLARAKEAVGVRGQLVVVTPNKKTIIATSDKKDVWPDDEREDNLGNNHHIDQLWVADMPEKYYPDPGVYWRQVWREIKPDLVFLGEKNHPLQATYNIQSKYLGGILLIDDTPVTRRSRELLV